MFSCRRDLTFPASRRLLKIILFFILNKLAPQKPCFLDEIPTFFVENKRGFNVLMS